MAAPNSQYDILLNQKGFMLARADQLGRGARAWTVTSAGSSTARLSDTESRYGDQPATVESPMVWRSTYRGYGDEDQAVDGRYHYAVNMDGRFPEQVLPGPLVTVLASGCVTYIAKIIEHRGLLYVIGGRYAKTIDTADDTVHDAQDFGATKAPLDAEVFNGSLYVGLGFAANDFIWQCNAAGAWAQDGDVQLGYMTSLKDKLWASTSPYQVANVAANPLTAADWSADYTIGDPGTSITAMGGLLDLLYIGKQDGLYVLDSSGISAQLTPELRAYQSAYNCANMKAWHGAWWVPHLRGLLNYIDQADAGFSVGSVGPGRDADTDNPVRGQVTALAGDDRWLYAALYTSAGDTYIMAGREAKGAEADALGQMIWHPLAKVAGKKCLAMTISGLWTNPRLWFGAGTDLCYIILPRDSDNPRTDTACRYATTGSIYYPAHSWGAPTTTKIWKSIVIESENLTPARYYDVYYRLDKAPAWTHAGRASTSPKHVLQLGVGQGVSGKRIEVRLDYASAASSTPGIIKSVVAWAAERPNQVEAIQAVIRCADNLPLRRGGARCPRTGAQMLAELKALVTQSTAVPLVDVVGLTRQVLVQAPVGEQETAQEGDLAREILATVKMTVFEVPDVSNWVAHVFGISYNAGGLAVPVAVPVGVGTTTLDLRETITCTNATASGFILTLAGPITNAVIENETAGITLDLTGTTIAAGDCYTFDLRAGYKTLKSDSGVDKSALLVDPTVLYTMHLDPGANVFHLTGVTLSAATAATLSYRQE